MDENYTAEQAFQALKQKYEITETDDAMARKIMAVRYEISRNGYSTTKSVTIAKDISNISAVQIREQNSMLSRNVCSYRTYSFVQIRKFSITCFRLCGCNKCRRI